MNKIFIPIKDRDECLRVQEALFSMGCRWKYWGESPVHLDSVSISVDTDGCLGWATYSSAYRLADYLGGIVVPPETILGE